MLVLYLYICDVSNQDGHILLCYSANKIIPSYDPTSSAELNLINDTKI